MGNAKEREMLKRAYPSKRWSTKVDQMSDAQATAVLLRMRQQGKI